MAENSAPSIRARVRAEMTDEIKRVALEHLATDGSALSLRAVARDMGMVSSALYRYFASRDDLLTALIIDAYTSMGDVAEQADAASVAEKADPFTRWITLGHAIRDWATARPHEYSLIYGSPIPGYAAPAETIEPAIRPVLVMAAIVRDAHAAGLVKATDDPDLGGPLKVEIGRVAAEFEGGTPVVARALAAWTQLFGALNFELFGWLNNVIDERREWFDWQLRAMASYVGLRADPGESTP